MSDVKVINNKQYIRLSNNNIEINVKQNKIQTKYIKGTNVSVVKDLDEFVVTYGIDKTDVTYYYIGYQQENRTNWRIQRINKSTYEIKWSVGNSNGLINWDNRINLIYEYEI